MGDTETEEHRPLCQMYQLIITDMTLIVMFEATYKQVRRLVQRRGLISNISANYTQSIISTSNRYIWSLKAKFDDLTISLIASKKPWSHF